MEHNDGNGDQPTRFSRSHLSAQMMREIVDPSNLPIGPILPTHEHILAEWDSEEDRRLFDANADRSSSEGRPLPMEQDTTNHFTLGQCNAPGTSNGSELLVHDSETGQQISVLENNENVDAEQLLQTVLSQKTTQRNRFKYAKHYLYRSADLYLKIDP